MQLLACIIEPHSRGSAACICRLSDQQSLHVLQATHNYGDGMPVLRAFLLVQQPSHTGPRCATAFTPMLAGPQGLTSAVESVGCRKYQTALSICVGGKHECRHAHEGCVGPLCAAPCGTDSHSERPVPQQQCTAATGGITCFRCPAEMATPIHTAKCNVRIGVDANIRKH